MTVLFIIRHSKTDEYQMLLANPSARKTVPDLLKIGLNLRVHGIGDGADRNAVYPVPAVCCCLASEKH